MASGAIHPKELAICRGIGNWLNVNAEAIYATRRWKIPAEGPITSWYLDAKREGIMWNFKKPNDDGEFRFTQSKDGRTVYAIMMSWPESGKAVIKSLRQGSPHHSAEINSVSLLGTEAPVKWSRATNGLQIMLPREKPCDYAFALRIQ
jgi:alpha-L-fucosidase